MARCPGRTLGRYLQCLLIRVVFTGTTFTTIARSKLTARGLLRKRGDYQAKQRNDHLHLCFLAGYPTRPDALVTVDVKLGTDSAERQTCE